MKANWQRWMPVAFYVGIALLWATGAGLSKMILVQNVKDAAAREQRLAAVSRYHESVQNNDLNQAFEVLTEDVKVQAPDTLLQGGWRSGKEEFRHLVSALQSQLRGKLEVNRYLDVGANQVLALVTLRDNQAGRRLDIPLVELFDFHEGRIRAVSIFKGDEALAQQLLRTHK